MEIRNSSNPNFESNLRPEISIVQAKQQTEIIQEKRDEVDLDSESKESHYGLEVDKVGRLNKQITTPVKREVLRPRRKYKKRMNVIDRGGYTLADFKKEWSIHPEWHGLSTGQINLIDRGQPFTTAIRKFAKKESKGNGDEYEKIMGEFFDGFKKYKERISRKDYNFNDFKEEWSRHPEWSHSLIDERQLKYRNSFYVALKIYIKKQTNGDEEESARMMKEFFPEYRERVDRNNYTLEDYKKEWEEHPEWHGLSTKQIQSTNGLNFYRTFKNFAIKKANGNNDECERIMRKFFPNYKIIANKIDRRHYTFADYKKEWEEHPEWHGSTTGSVSLIEGGASFYLQFLKFAKNESRGDKDVYSKLMKEFFPEYGNRERVDRSHYTFADYKKEWEEHPEWHGFSSDQLRGIKGGLSFYKSIQKFAKKEAKGDFEEQEKIIDYFFPFRMKMAMVYAERGYIFQYLIEILLKIVNNKNFLVENNFVLNGQKFGIKPDLVYEYNDGQKVIVFDIKLQTTTDSIGADMINYRKLINERYPEGGNLIFLCLNGPKMQKEIFEEGKITVRYYHVLDFLERLIDNNRNKFLMEMMSSDENMEESSNTSFLSQIQIDKIKEIIMRLRVLRELVSRKRLSTKNNTTVDEVANEIHEMRIKLSSIAKNKKITIEEILQIDFNKILNF